MKGTNITLLILAVIIIIGGIVWAFNSQNQMPSNTNDSMMEQNTFRLTSPVFENNSSIPQEFTCDGNNLSPELNISGVPEEAQSLVLIMDDPDIPEEVKGQLGRDDFVHWVLFNIRPTTDNIQQGRAPGVSGVNSSGDLGYTGPCPPTEFEPTEHRYFFKLYAVDTELELAEGASKEEVEQAIDGHILAQTELIGRYDRRSR